MSVFFATALALYATKNSLKNFSLSPMTAYAKAAYPRELFETTINEEMLKSGDPSR